jgi:hypothetical protein
MKHRLLSPLIAALFFSGSLGAAEPPPMPKPAKEHEWLKKFVGEWNIETEVLMTGQPSMKVQGTESARMLGGFWILGENKSDFMGQAFSGLMSLGFDPEENRFVGSWIDSNSPALWEYTGTLDEAAQVLTLNTKGYCPMEGQVCQFRQTVEFKSPDQRVLTAERLGKDGRWKPSMTIIATRKK